MKKEFLRVSDCLFKGHAIKFFDWIPNFREDNLDLTIPTWFVINSFPPKLHQIGIIRRIGRTIGELIGLDVSFESCNNIKLLIKQNVNNKNPKQLKLITNRSTYNLNFQKYDGKISEIIRLDDERKSSFRFLPRTLDLNYYLSKISKRQLSMLHEEHESGENWFTNIKDETKNSRVDKLEKEVGKGNNSAYQDKEGWQDRNYLSLEYKDGNLQMDLNNSPDRSKANRSSMELL